MKTLVQRARAFAALAHTGQERKYTGDPYFTHCENVARIVSKLPESTEEMIAAALLHDTVEDTDITLEDIYAKFGVTVQLYVAFLTDISIHTPHLNRAARKALDREHIRCAPPEVKSIKLADLIDNTSSIVKHDPKFAKVYLEEKRLLLPCLQEGNKSLWVKAHKLANQPVEV